MVDIDEKELERLQDCANELACLEYMGVDNWVGYENLYEMLKENFPETCKRKYGEDSEW